MSVLSEDTQKSVQDNLLKDGILTEQKLIEAKHKAEAEHAPLISTLVKYGYVNNEQLTKYIAHANNLPYVNLKDAFVEESYLDLLPKDTAEHYMAVPLGEIDNKIIIGMLDADNVQAVDFLQNKIGRPIKVYAASEEGIKNVLKQYKISIDDSAVEQYAGEEDKDTAKRAATQVEEDHSIKTIVQDSPISKALNTILEYAATNRASDIHMEPTETELRIRCRIDGVLREIMKLPKSTEPALVSRVKILSNLKIDEHRVPQDGEFSIKSGTKKI